jgi:hypothetical protein
VSRGTWVPAAKANWISPTGLSPSSVGLPMPFGYPFGFLLCRSITVLLSQVPLPLICNGCNLSHKSGLGSSAFARHYLRNHSCFLFLRVLRCFSSPGYLRHAYVFSMRYWPMTTSGFPHSDIHGSKLAYSSPWHFGVRSVLLRLLAPRHPPCALPTFTCFDSSCG